MRLLLSFRGREAFMWALLPVWIAMAGTMATSSAQAVAAPARTPVLVELYTSEGCSTCPPADDLLADLAQHQPIAGVLVVPLAEHVDYWNQLGWTDRFSSSVYSQRQRAYAKNMNATQVYTPQAVVGGTMEVLGSDRPSLIHAIATAAKASSGVLTLSNSGASDGALQLSVTLSGAGPGDSPGLYAAVTDDEDSSMVSAGENGGHSLHHVDAVRSMQYFGPITDGQPKLLTIKLPADAAKKKMHVVVFAQIAGQGRVIAVASGPV